MNIKILKILFFCFALSLETVWAESKIALIGDSEKARKVAELVLAEQSGQLNFLERASIDKVLKEHKLASGELASKQMSVIAKLLHADVFAVLSSAQINGKVEPSSLRVFDARNGFCLTDITLPLKIDECAEFVGQELRKAVKVLANRKKLKLVSILAVRNAGAPTKYKRQMEHIAMLLERWLIAMPEIAVLERSELGLVNREREVTDKYSKLASSAYLLDLEFAPTSSTDKIDLHIYVLDASGKELKNFNFPNCLKTEIDELIKILAEYFKTAPPERVLDNKQEAKRFFMEYEFFNKKNKRKIARRKLDAAISLSPDNPVYLYSLAKYVGTPGNYFMPPGQGNAQKFMFLLDIVKKSMKIYDEVKERFPDYQRIIYKPHCKEAFRSLDGKKFLYSPVPACKKILYDIDALSSMQWIFVNSNKNFLNEQQRKETRKVMAEFRTKFFQEALKYDWEFDPEDGINSLEELNNFAGSQNKPCDLKYFFDYDDYIDFSYNWLEKCLQANSDFLRKYPRYMKTYNYVPSFFPGNNFFDSAKWNKNIEDSCNLITIAKKHPVKDVRSYAYSWELYKELVKEQFDPEKFRASLKKHLNLHKIFPGKLEIALFRKYPRLYIILKEEKKEFELKQKKFNSLDILFSGLKVEKNIEKLADIVISHPPDILELRSFRNFPNKLFPIYDFGKKLAEKNTEKCRKALAMLNSSFVVKKIKARKDFGNFSLNPGRFENVTMKDGKIYLIILNPMYKHMRHKNNDFLKIYCFNPENNALSEAGSIKENPFKKLYVVNSIFLVTAENFLFSAEDQVLVIPRNGGKYYTIKDLPARGVMTMTVMDKRLYAFLGYVKPWGNTPPSETILFSCLLDGSDRKIHISTVRRRKKHFFDKQKPFKVTNLIADEKRHRLLFTADKTLNGFWEFYPSNGVYKAIIKMDKRYNVWSMRQGEKVYVVGGNIDYYIFNLKYDKIDFLFYRFKPSNIKYMKTKPRFAKDIRGVGTPCLIGENSIWSGNCQLMYVGFDSGEIFSQYIFGIKSSFSAKVPLFPHTDGHSVWAVAEWAIYKITPPEMKKGKKDSATNYLAMKNINEEKKGK